MVVDRAVFFNSGEFGSTATYTPTGGAAKTVDVVITYSEDLAAFSAGNTQAAFAIAEFRRDQVTDPKKYEKFVIDGVTWQMETVIQADAENVMLRLSTDQRAA